MRRLCYTGSRIYIPGIGNEQRSVEPKRVVLQSRGEDSLLEYGQGVRVYKSSKDLCTSLVHALAQWSKLGVYIAPTSLYRGPIPE